MQKNISLIGFMGSGKSTVGKILAEQLDFLFIDTDRVIELAENRSIPEIFRSNGEGYFRDIESDVISKLYKNKKCVFACGGGVIIRDANMQIISDNSTVVYLCISPEKAYERLKDSEDRPMLDAGDRLDRINKLIESRQELYLKYADIVLEPGEKDPVEIGKEILLLLKKIDNDN